MLNPRKILSLLETASEKTAKALVRRSDISVVARGMEAHYNWKTKTLTVPAYSIRDDATVEHILAWRGILDHECAHVEHSDGVVYDTFLDSWKGKFGREQTQRAMTVANVFEDFFIERVWVLKNPGSVKHLAACNTLVIRETGGAACCHPEYVPDGSIQPVGEFTALIQSMLRVGGGYVEMSDIDPKIASILTHLADEIAVGMVATTSEEVCIAAEAVWEKLKDLAEKEPEPEEGEGQQEEGEGQQEEGEGSGSGDNSDEGEAGEAGGEGDEGGEDGDNADEGGEGGEAGDNAGDSAGDEGGGGQRAEQGDNRGDVNGDDPRSKKEERNEGDSVGPVSGEAVVIAAADGCCGGEYGEIKTAGEIVAGFHVGVDATRPYTINPDSASNDVWEKYSREQRSDARPQAVALRASAGPAITTMANLMRCAVKAQKQTLWVGGLEEGEDLDPDALPGLASGAHDSRIFRDKFAQVDDNTFVCVLVDCSGSMGNSKPLRWCPEHGEVDQKGVKCSRKLSNGKRCNEELIWKVTTKAGYAAMTATVLHDALRLCGTAHAVLGYTNMGLYSGSKRGEQGVSTFTNEDGQSVDRPKWSRCSSALWMHEFVAAPGLSDDGGALPYITGYNCNLDGESVIAAAKYATARAAGIADRIVLLVIADGAPAGADDYALEQRHLTDCVETVAHAGIEVYGIGVGVGKRFSKFYPDVAPSDSRAGTGNVLIKSGHGLSSAVMKQLTDLLVRSNGRSR